LRGWEKVRKAVHETGAKIIPQLWHVGDVRRLGMAPYPEVPGLGPIEIYESGVLTVKAMTTADVETVASAYARSALHARELGFDGVAIHGAHGYLIDQFLWSSHNTRRDAYGGDMIARCRPGCQIIRTIREAVGSDFPIIFRFSQWKMTDYDAKIANTSEELSTMLNAFKQAGVDTFDASTRRFWDPAFEGSPDSLAAWTKRLSQCPTIAVGSIGLDQPHQSKYFRATAKIDANVTDLDNVVSALNRGDFDLAAVGRAILADPNWAIKVAENRIEDITPFERAHLERYV
jgi:2,4-dienoyl-CoA reductase-like NADH-dependent reductase (Old Yellow Enzyme family)